MNNDSVLTQELSIDTESKNDHDQSVPSSKITPRPMDLDIENVTKINQENPLEPSIFSSQAKYIVAVSLLAYLAQYFTRSTLNLLSPIIIKTNLTFNSTNLGLIYAFGYVGTALGKLINGMLADKNGGLAILVNFLIDSCMINFILT